MLADIRHIDRASDRGHGNAERRCKRRLEGAHEGPIGEEVLNTPGAVTFRHVDKAGDRHTLRVSELPVAGAAAAPGRQRGPTGRKGHDAIVQRSDRGTALGVRHIDVSSWGHGDTVREVELAVSVAGTTELADLSPSRRKDEDGVGA